MDVCRLNNDYFYYKDPIGYGSFSMIYKGYKHNCENPFAIKQITKIIDMRHFNNEVELMKKLDHPNILKLYDVVVKNKKIYLILEYCNSGDLSSYIKSASNKFNYKYLKQIMNGLKYLYKKNILHRDIKPQNILIHDDNIKISDFGFAKSFEKNELITTFCGSPLYMAPEIINKREYNEKSDIWSLGVILYELFCKKHPYYTESKETLWKNIKNGIQINCNEIKDNSIRFLIESLLINDADKRCNWDKLFNNYSKLQINNSIYNSFGSIFQMEDIPVNTNNKITQSVIIPKRNRFDSLTNSENINNIDEKVIDYDDYRIISKSAPNNLGLSYLENYMKNKEKKTTEDKSIHILGSSPAQNSNNISYYLDKSVKSVNSLFNYFNYK
jgi:serine/threonine protein kinase